MLIKRLFGDVVISLWRFRSDLVIYLGMQGPVFGCIC